MSKNNLRELSLSELDKKYGLSAEEVYRPCNPKEFDFESTGELKPLEGIESIVGQEKYVEMLKDYVEIDDPYHNVLVIGPSGSGKKTMAKVVVDEVAKSKKIKLYDQVACYNFEDPENPKIFALEAGKGKFFKEEMDSIIENFLLNYEERRKKEEDALRENLRKEYNERLSKYGLKIEYDPFSSVEVLKSENELEVLSIIGEYEDKIFGASNEKEREKAKRELMERLSAHNVIPVFDFSNHTIGYNGCYEAQLIVSEYARELSSIAIKARERIELMIEREFYLLKEKIGDEEEVSEYLDTLRKEIKRELGSKEDTRQFSQLPGVNVVESTSTDEGSDFEKYRVNLLVDNSRRENMPYEVVRDISDLFTIKEKGSGSGLEKPEHMKVRAGKLVKNNGGVIILDAEALLYGFPGYKFKDTLLEVLESGKENVKNVYGRKLESTCMAKTKIILSGNGWYEYFLEDDFNAFRRFFKVINIDREMKNLKENRKKVARFVASEIKKYNEGKEEGETLPEFSNEGVAAFIDYLTSLSGKKRINLQLGKARDIVILASKLAKNRKKKHAGREEVFDAIKRKREERNRYEDYIKELIKEGYLYVGRGKEVGAANGLAVYPTEIPSGTPTRRAVNVVKSRGGEGRLNIDGETGLAGKTAKKSFEELIFLLKEKYVEHGEEMPDLDITFTVSQNYEGYDGPSAGAVDFCALLSAISGLELYQSVFVTGAIEPKSGKVLAVGGINEKVKAAYYTSKLLGIEEAIAVIPKANKNDLQIIEEEIIDDIKNGKFRVYVHDNYLDTMEILTRLPRRRIEKMIREGLEKFREEVEEAEGDEIFFNPE